MRPDLDMTPEVLPRNPEQAKHSAQHTGPYPTHSLSSHLPNEWLFGCLRFVSQGVSDLWRRMRDILGTGSENMGAMEHDSNFYRTDEN